MATRKKTTTKKTTKKAKDWRSSPPSPDSTPAKPEPESPGKPTVEVRPYKHVGDQVNAFLAKHKNGVYFHLDAVSKQENENAIKSLDPNTPCFVDGRSFSASELKALGFDVFQNGPDGKLVGIRK